MHRSNRHIPRPRLAGSRLAASWLFSIAASAFIARAQAGDLGGLGANHSPRPSPAAASTKAAHVRILGDLESLKQASDFHAAVEKARAADARVLILEFSGDRWRPDVALRIARTILDSRKPAPDRPALRVVAFLSDDNDQHVSGACVALARLADDAAVEPQTSLRAELGDLQPLTQALIAALGSDSFHDLVPAPSRSTPDSPPDQPIRASNVDQTQELNEALVNQFRILIAGTLDQAHGRSVQDDRAPTPAPRASWERLLPIPLQPAWWIEQDPWLTPEGPKSPARRAPAGHAGAPSPRARVSLEAPAHDHPFPTGLFVGPADADPKNLRLELSARDALKVGLAQTIASSPTSLLASLEFRGSIILRTTIQSKLEDARNSLRQNVEFMQDDLRRIDADLKDAARSRSSETLPKRQRTGRESIARLAKVEQTLQSSEQLLADHPELLADVPPGKTSVGQPDSDIPRLWRATFQTLRDDLADAKARAQSLADSQPN